jgi:UPF0271 protein
MEAKTTEKPRKKALVLDTSAFITGFDPFSVSEEQFSVPTVKEELIFQSMPGMRFQAAVESGKLKLVMPSAKFLNSVREASKTVGDMLYLSDADFEVLALALELKHKGYSPTVVTDDYSIQNVANQIGVKFAPLATFGIRYRLEWTLYCPACHKRYPSDYKLKTCGICGTELKRKPSRKKAV